ncbi:hypothetical protein NQZ68_022983 [Dissostichus eleginoides]|nr:hypothetical protein NQZ68_022983 [Dissostichus eleginoides]
MCHFATNHSALRCGRLRIDTLFISAGYCRAEQRCSQRLGATGGIREQREINYCLCLGLKQAVSETIYKRRTKGAGGPSNAQASGDGVKSILSRALTRSHHCQQHKIGPCHTSK